MKTMNEEEYKLVQCGSCGCKHYIPRVMFDHCQEKGGFWQCPNGHGWGFKEGRHEQEAVRRERDRLKQENARLEQITTEVRRELSEATKKIKRQNSRSIAGLCPCCNRYFNQLARHMRTKHPDQRITDEKVAVVQA